MRLRKDWQGRVRTPRAARGDARSPRAARGQRVAARAGKPGKRGRATRTEGTAPADRGGAPQRVPCSCSGATPAAQGGQRPVARRRAMAHEGGCRGSPSRKTSKVRLIARERAPLGLGGRAGAGSQEMNISAGRATRRAGERLHRREGSARPLNSREGDLARSPGPPAATEPAAQSVAPCSVQGAQRARKRRVDCTAPSRQTGAPHPHLPPSPTSRGPWPSAPRRWHG